MVLAAHILFGNRPGFRAIVGFGLLRLDRTLLGDLCRSLGFLLQILVGDLESAFLSYYAEDDDAA